ncbi:MAG: NUDIX hydrolase [Lachnospiraceae bacterium]|nr:NUDIX hydrolase [Lachnospiraceae bacterium]MBQ1400505.1 NUDIX hydrolase [Lachnospiraceae bacterium]MBQ1516218.1 NUDIX hydrolase [Lachnospiraceae bacterium]
MEARRIKRELIHKGVVIDYYVDTMELEDGRTTPYDYIHHNGATAIVPVTKDGKIILVRQWRNALDRYTWEIPAGKREGDEDYAVCAARELEEETGYRAETIEHLFTMIPTIAYLDEVIDIYVARGLTFVGQELDEDEEITVRAFAVDEITGMIFSGTIQDGKTAAGVLAYKEKYLRILSE